MSVYQKNDIKEKESSRTLSLIVDNQPGTLARVIGLFSGRGYNIESLTVTEVDNRRHLSRISLVTRGTSMTIEQIKSQLLMIVPVHLVRDLTLEGPFIECELALIKLVAKGSGISNSYTVNSEVDYDKIMDTVYNEDGPSLIVIKCQAKATPLVFPHSFDGSVSMNRFMSTIKS